MDCLFCKIIAGEIPCSKVYEDDDFLGFLDLYPVNPGHTLIVPKVHFRNLLDVPADVAAKTYGVASKVAAAVMQAMNADGINLVQNNEEAGGQVVFHSHLHLIPRFSDDGLKVGGMNKKYDSMELMQEVAGKIAALLK